MDDAQLWAVLDSHTAGSEWWAKVAELASTRLKEERASAARAELRRKLGTGEYFVRWRALHHPDCTTAQEGIQIALMAVGEPHMRLDETVELIHQDGVANYTGRRCKVCAPLGPLTVNTPVSESD